MEQKYQKLTTRSTLCIFVDTNRGLGSCRPEKEKDATCIFTAKIKMITVNGDIRKDHCEHGWN